MKQSLHTPDELLENAEILFNSNNAKMLRGSILEAISALETFVKETVFAQLENKLDPLLVSWLKNKTRMDFDTRLSVLTPIATGISIDRQSKLWNDYKRAKEIRNKVTHTGRVVSRDEARFVIDTVYSWLSYLGVTVGLNKALRNFKNYVEDNQFEITNEAEGNDLLSSYLRKTTTATISQEHRVNTLEGMFIIDFVLKFGEELGIIEVKLARKFSIDFLESAIKQSKELTDVYLNSDHAKAFGNIDSVTTSVVIFTKEELPEYFNTMYKPSDRSIIHIVKVL